jgi:hypothetical protein
VVKKFIRGLLTAINYLVDTPVEKYLPELKKHFSGLSDKLLIDIFTRTRATFKLDGVTTEESYNKVAAFLIDTGAITKVAPFKELVTNDYLPAR